MQVINTSKTETSKGKQSMKAGILVLLWDMVYIYFKASFISSLLPGLNPSISKDFWC